MRVEDEAFVLYATAGDGVIHRQPLNIDGLVETLFSKVQRDLTPVERATYGLDDAPPVPSSLKPRRRYATRKLFRCVLITGSNPRLPDFLPLRISLELSFNY